MNLRKLKESSVDLQIIINANHYLLEFVKAEVLIPGRIETWNIIIDLEGQSSLKYPKSRLENIINEMTKFYPSRLNLMIMINAPKIVKFIMKTKSLFKSKSDSSIHLYAGEDYRELLFNYISRKQLENKYGGVCPNLLTNFFPPFY